MSAEPNELIFKPGDVLFDTEKPLDCTYFILEGSVNLVLALGTKTVELNIGENQFIGDAAVVVGPKTDGKNPQYHAIATACDTVKVVEISIDEIKSELDSCSPLLKAWFSSFTSRVLVVIQKLSEM